MNVEDVVLEMPKKHKQHKMSWEQASKDVKSEKQKEKFKDARKAGREAKRNNI